MNIFQEYEEYDALGLAQLVKQGDITPEELLETAISRVEKYNPKLNAVVIKMYDLARASIAKGLPAGALRGVPFLLKDLGVYIIKGSQPVMVRGCLKRLSRTMIRNLLSNKDTLKS